MFLSLRRVLPIAVLTLPVRSIISNDLGQGYAERMGYTFCQEREMDGDEKRRKGKAKKGNKEEENEKKQ